MENSEALTPDMSQELSVRAGQVFRPRSPVSSREFFAGRWEQITAVADAVFQTGLHIVIFGERGVGKTSLANIVAPILNVMEEDLTGEQGGKGAQRIVIKVNVTADDQFSSIWRRAFDEITWTEDGPSIGFKPPINETSQTLRRAFGISDDPTIDEIRRTLSYLRRSVFIFDEFDRADDSVRRVFTDLIKTLSDYAIDSTVVLVGVASTIDDLIKDHKSIVRAIVQILLPRMNTRELRDIIDKAVRALGISVEDDAANLIVRMSQGLPHYTHLIGLHSSREAVRRLSRVIKVPHVYSSFEKAVNQAIQSIRELYHTAVHSAHKGALYDRVLLACATAASTSKDQLGYFHPADLVTPLSTILDRDNVTIATFQKHITEFTEIGRGPILDRSGAPRAYKYRFRDPLMPPFIFMTAVAEGTIKSSRLAQLLGTR